MMQSFVWVGVDLSCEAEVQPILYQWLPSTLYISVTVPA